MFYARMFLATVMLHVSSIGFGADHKITSGQLADFVLTGWRSEREKLITGKVHMSGSYRKGNMPPIALKVLTVFDHTRGMRKYHTVWGPDEGHWITTPEFLAQCAVNAAPVIDLIKPTDPPLWFVRDRDPRSFGVGPYSNLNQGVTFEDTVRGLTGLKLKDARRIGEGLYELEGTIKRINPTVGKEMVTRHVGVFNERKGFSCERFEYVRKNRPDAQWKVTSRYETQWTSIDGIWVPADVHAVNGMNKEEETIDLTLRWEQVNQPLSNEEFDVRGLDVPKGTLISDRRLGTERRVVIGKIREEDPPESGGRSPIFRATTVTVLAINGILVAVLIAYVLVRGTKKKPASAPAESIE